MTLIAIDGPAGAGKTTLAAQFQRDFSKVKSVSIIHMDSLYAGWDNVFGERLTSQLEIIVSEHNALRPFTVKIFNWASMVFDSCQTIEPTDILIIEGVGAGQRIVRDAGAITYWLDIEPSVGLERVLQRDGYEIESQMRQWQSDQEEHFASDLTRNHAHYILTS